MKRVLFVLLAAMLLLAPAQARAAAIVFNGTGTFDGTLFHGNVANFLAATPQNGGFYEPTTSGVMADFYIDVSATSINGFLGADYDVGSVGDPGYMAFTIPELWMGGSFDSKLTPLTITATGVWGDGHDSKDNAFASNFGLKLPLDGTYTFSFSATLNQTTGLWDYNLNNDPAPSSDLPGIVPEPASLLLLGTGLLGLAARARRRAR